MGLGKNKSAITHIEIGFREIDRFFDIHGAGGGSRSSPPRVPTVRELADPIEGAALQYDPESGPTIGVPGSTSAPGSPRYLPGVAALDSHNNARLVIRNPFASVGTMLIDENGDLVRETVTEMPGVYRSLRTDGEWFFARTFARKKSRPIDRKYVYVWAADDKQGTGIRLIRELFFEDGKFQLIDFNSKERTAKGSPRERLVLDLISFQDAQPKQLYYFFLLARFQIPRDRLDEISADIPARGMRLWDEFYTDLCPTGKLENGTPVDEPPRSGDELPPQAAYLMYLVDPFREATYRAERFRNALHRWQHSVQTLSENEEYTFAKNLELLRRQAETCPNCLRGDFDHYISETEAESERLCFAMYCLASDLVQWIGQAEIRESISINGASSDTWLGNGNNRVPAKEDKGADKWHNHYCQAIHDYADRSNDRTGDPGAARELGELICTVVGQLELSPRGDQWLGEVFENGIAGRKLDKLRSGGIDIYFEAELGNSSGDADEAESETSEADDDDKEASENIEGQSEGEGESESESKGEAKEEKEKRVENPGKADAGKKYSEAAKTLATGLLTRFAEHFVEHYRADALKKFPKWYRKKFGLKIYTTKAVLPSKIRKTVRAEEKRLATLIVRKAEYKTWRGSLLGLKPLNFGLNLLVLCNEAEEAKEGDNWKRLEALGSLLDTLNAGYETFFEHHELLEEVEGAGSYAGKIFKFVGIASAAIDVVTGFHEAYVAESVPAQVAAEMSTIGAGMVLAGAFNEEHPGGWAATIIGAIVQGSGSLLKEATEPLCVFLRNCRWGAGPIAADSLGAWWKDEDKPWYHGKLSDLRGQDDASKLRQLRCADYFTYYFVPEVTFEQSGFNCKLKIKMKGASKVLGPQAKWDVSVILIKDRGEILGPETVTLQPEQPCHDWNWTAEQSIGYPILDANDFVQNGYSPPWAVNATVKIKLLVYGDERHLVEREANESSVFSSPWQPGADRTDAASAQ